jgi:three-Cys-motif partner protein
MDVDTGLPECGPWAVEKLGFLKNYLTAYTTIIRKHFRRFTYIDAFAGPGSHKVRDRPNARETLETGQRALLADPIIANPEEDGSTAAFIDGSPRIALGIEHRFTDYVFVDLDSSRIEKLSRLKTEFPEASIHVRQEDCNSYLAKVVPEIDWSGERAVAFLDPFGMHAYWQTIELLARTRAIEVFINFPVGMAMQYFLRRDGDIQERDLRRLDTYMGTREWFDIVYETTDDLIGRNTIKRNDSGHRLACWYAGKLRSVFGFASPPRLVRNTRGSYLYYLIWAGPNKTGEKIAKHVLESGEMIDCWRYT